MLQDCASCPKKVVSGRDIDRAHTMAVLYFGLPDDFILRESYLVLRTFFVIKVYITVGVQPNARVSYRISNRYMEGLTQDV